MTKINSYAFDVPLRAIVHVTAPTIEDARAAMQQCIDCMDLSTSTVEGVNSTMANSIVVTEASLNIDPTEDLPPFEINGTPMEPIDNEDELGRGERFVVFENSHGFRIVRLADGAETTFYGDDSCERFRDHFSGDLNPDDSSENRQEADDVGDWAEEEGEF
jgi:hypothetical protein